jgi:hypothetical protein
MYGYMGEACTLVYPRHAFAPEDLLNFVEMEGFSADWKELRLDDDDLFILQVAIMANPKGAPVVQGTGGLRKLRFSPPRWPKGKSGGVRVCYVYFEEYKIVLLVIAYAKGTKDDLSARERKAIKHLIEREEAMFSKRFAH